MSAGLLEQRVGSGRTEGHWRFSSLKGAQLAIIVFENLQCPQCGRSNPLLEQGQQDIQDSTCALRLPIAHAQLVVQRCADSPAISTPSPRSSAMIFATMSSPTNWKFSLTTCASIAEKFAADHKVTLPFAIGPAG